jgi:hypothetical protein
MARTSTPWSLLPAKELGEAGRIDLERVSVDSFSLRAVTGGSDRRQSHRASTPPPSQGPCRQGLRSSPLPALPAAAGATRPRIARRMVESSARAWPPPLDDRTNRGLAGLMAAAADPLRALLRTLVCLGHAGLGGDLLQRPPAAAMVTGKAFHDSQVGDRYRRGVPARIYLLGGSSSVGKTTAAAVIAERLGAVHLQLDSIGGCPARRGTSVAVRGDQAASSLVGGTLVAIVWSRVARRAGRCRWPLTRRNCLAASTIPAATQRSTICPSCQRLTLAA